MLSTLLIAILVISAEGVPVAGAAVEVEGRVNYHEFYEESTTDSRGVFVVEVNPGVHMIAVRWCFSYRSE